MANTQKSPDAKAGDPAKKVSPDAKKEESKSIDTSVLDKVLKAFEETNKKLEAFQKQSDDKDKETAALREEILKLKSKSAGSNNHDEEIVDDYLEVPVVLFCYRFAFSLPSYKYRGKTYKAPNGNIHFKLLHRYKLGDGAQAKVHAVSAVKVQSRADLEYLRTFPGYGYMIHEKDQGPERIDTMMADFLTKEASRINGMTEHSMIQMCQSEGIGVTTDLAQMKRELITKRATNAMNNYSKLMKAEGEKAARMATNAKNIQSGLEPKYIDKELDMANAPRL